MMFFKKKLKAAEKLKHNFRVVEKTIELHSKRRKVTLFFKKGGSHSYYIERNYDFGYHMRSAYHSLVTGQMSVKVAEGDVMLSTLIPFVQDPGYPELNGYSPENWFSYPIEDSTQYIRVEELSEYNVGPVELMDRKEKVTYLALEKISDLPLSEQKS